MDRRVDLAMDRDQQVELGLQIGLRSGNVRRLGYLERFGEALLADGECDLIAAWRDQWPGDDHFRRRIFAGDLGGWGVAQIPDEAVPTGVGGDLQLLGLGIVL